METKEMRRIRVYVVHDHLRVEDCPSIWYITRLTEAITVRIGYNNTRPSGMSILLYGAHFWSLTMFLYGQMINFHSHCLAIQHPSNRHRAPSPSGSISAA